MLQLDKHLKTEANTDEWIRGLSRVLKFTDQRVRPGLRATLSCKVSDGEPSLFLPPELATLQPDILSYLHALGAANNITLIEDRREIDIQPMTERRSKRPSDLALGVSLLLRQTGLPGPAHCLSKPHVLRPDNPQISLPKLINMAAHVQPGCKKVVFIPNRFLTGDFSEQAKPMTGYACKVITQEEQITISYFNSPDFHAMGYISNDQFVIHVFLAGGPISSPKIWSPFSIMTDSAFRCQVFKSKSAAHHFGILYSTLYIDLEASMETEPWWTGIEETDHASSPAGGSRRK